MNELRVLDDGSLFSAWKIKREAFSPLKLPFIINKCLKKKFALILSCYIYCDSFLVVDKSLSTLWSTFAKNLVTFPSHHSFSFFLHLLGFCCTVCKKSSKIFAYIREFCIGQLHNIIALSFPFSLVCYFVV